MQRLPVSPSERWREELQAHPRRVVDRRCLVRVQPCSRRRRQLCWGRSGRKPSGRRDVRNGDRRPCGYETPHPPPLRRSLWHALREIRTWCPRSARFGGRVRSPSPPARIVIAADPGDHCLWGLAPWCLRLWCGCLAAAGDAHAPDEHGPPTRRRRRVRYNRPSAASRLGTRSWRWKAGSPAPNWYVVVSWPLPVTCSCTP